MTRAVRALAWGGLIAAAAGLTAACSSEAASPQTQDTRGADAVPVTVAPVVQKSMPLDLNIVGTAEASATVAVRAQITGSLMSVDFKEGEDVQAGQALFTLDRRPLEAALAQAQANLDRDMAQEANARTQAGRYQALSQRGIVSSQEVQASATTAAALAATVEADKAAIENAKVQLDYATITAPISGRTGALIVHAGNLVRANDTTPLVVINQVSPINVTFGIPESQLATFKRYLAQRTLRVEARPPDDTDTASRGEISFVDNAVDQATGTIKVKGSFTNENHHLWPGQFVNVVVTLATEPTAIVVPTVAVQAGQDGQYVYVVKADQTVDLRTVTVARTRGTETIIQDGLKAGESVITDGQVRLVQGSRITVKTGLGEKVTE